MSEEAKIPLDSIEPWPLKSSFLTWGPVSMHTMLEVGFAWWCAPGAGPCIYHVTSLYLIQSTLCSL
jgi:hypothetical protein